MNIRRTTFKKKSDKPDKDEKAAKTIYGVTVLLNNIAEASSKSMACHREKQDQIRVLKYVPAGTS